MKIVKFNDTKESKKRRFPFYNYVTENKQESLSGHGTKLTTYFVFFRVIKWENFSRSYVKTIQLYLSQFVKQFLFQSKPFCVSAEAVFFHLPSGFI